MTKEQELLAQIETLKAALATAKAPKVTVPLTTKVLALPLDGYRAKVLRNIGWMKIPLDVNTTLGDYQTACGKYIAANPPKPKAAVVVA